MIKTSRSKGVKQSSECLVSIAIMRVNSFHLVRMSGVMPTDLLSRLTRVKLNNPTSLTCFSSMEMEMMRIFHQVIISRFLIISQPPADSATALTKHQLPFCSIRESISVSFSHPFHSCIPSFMPGQRRKRFFTIKKNCFNVSLTSLIIRQREQVLTFKMM